jgi:hypothetical protein
MLDLALCNILFGENLDEGVDGGVLISSSSSSSRSISSS